jgi:hypothetical protein
MARTSLQLMLNKSASTRRVAIGVRAAGESIQSTAPACYHFHNSPLLLSVQATAEGGASV